MFVRLFPTFATALTGIILLVSAHTPSLDVRTAMSSRVGTDTTAECCLYGNRKGCDVANFTSQYPLTTACHPCNSYRSCSPGDIMECTDCVCQTVPTNGYVCNRDPTTVGLNKCTWVKTTCGTFYYDTTMFCTGTEVVLPPGNYVAYTCVPDVGVRWDAHTYTKTIQYCASPSAICTPMNELGYAPCSG